MDKPLGSSPIHKLIALKRYEKPDPAYFNHFLTEFKARRQEIILSRKPKLSFFSRFFLWVKQDASKQLLYGAGFAYASIFLLAFFLWSHPSPQQSQAPALQTSPVKHTKSQVLPAHSLEQDIKKVSNQERKAPQPPLY